MVFTDPPPTPPPTGAGRTPTRPPTPSLLMASRASSVVSWLAVGLGVALSQAVSAVSPLPATVAPWSVALAVIIGAGVGIIAGAYPASRASRMDPIYAMRQE